MDETQNEQPKQPASSSCSIAGRINWQQIARRARDIILDPQGVWGRIKAEEQTIEDLFKNYVFVLVAIPVVCDFLRMVSLGQEVGSGVIVHWPFFQGLLFSVVSYFLHILSIFVLALIIEKLSPRFSCSVTRIDALKLVIYSMTPVLIAGIFFLFPGFSILVVFAGFYSLYVFYQGFGPMTGVAEQNKNKYFAGSILGCFVAMLIIGIVLFSVGPEMPRPNVEMPKTLKLPGNVNVDTEQLQKGLNQIEKTVDEFRKAVPAEPR